MMDFNIRTASVAEVTHQGSLKILDLPTELHPANINCTLASAAVNLNLACGQLFQCGTPMEISCYFPRKDLDLSVLTSAYAPKK